MMIQHRIFLFFLIIFLSSDFVAAQKSISSPLNIPLISTGSFAEPRMNHFHSGIDLKTQGREGLPVFSIDDGEIVRIKISPYGYGRAIYINHPGGITSVYGHLSAFADKIDLASRAYQYSIKNNEIDWFPSSGSLKVKKGEQIALSGNSGGSGAPHLHFEIRETSTEKPIDPIEYGLVISDKEFPVIKSLYIYPMADGSQADGHFLPYRIPVSGNSGLYKTELPSPFRISGTIGFGIETYDPQSGSDGKNGVRSIDLELYGRSIFYVDFGKFSFDETRFTNAQIDYSKRIKEKKIIHRMHVLPGDGYSGYKHLFNRGLINSNPGNVYKLKCIVKDGNGNTSVIEFECVGVEPLQWPAKAVECESSVTLIPGVKNSVSRDGISINFGGNTVYDTTEVCFIPINLNPEKDIKFRIGPEDFPVHQSYQINLNLKKLQIPYSSKLCLFRRSEKGEYIFESNNVSTDELKADVRSFGEFVIMKDESAPLISLQKTKPLSFKISDALSGIASYSLLINNNWERVYFDAKSGKLTPDLSAYKKGETLRYELKVSDKAGNKTELKGQYLN